MQHRIKIKSHNKNEKKKKKMKSTKTINKYPQPDLNQGCPDWMTGILTTTLTVLAGRHNYNIHIGKRALFTVVTEDCRCYIIDL